MPLAAHTNLFVWSELILDPCLADIKHSVSLMSLTAQRRKPPAESSARKWVW